MRRIKITEPLSSFSARCDLLDDLAPASCAFLRELAARQASFEAMHAIWTGPEISVPIPASALDEDLAARDVPVENATSFPEAGDIVLASIAAGTIKGLPPGNFFDIGVFYAPGGRLLMPFGWLQASVCARIVPEDFAAAQESAKAIRRNGACTITIEPS
jgi:hypothetical protein